MYATKKQLLDLIAILENSCTTEDECNTSDHHHDLFDDIDRDRLNAMRIELEEEIEVSEIPANL
jgi:hypothetical protein